MSHPSPALVRAQHRVQLWFGAVVLRTYRADPTAANEYARSVGRRFPGLRVTVDEDPTQGLEPLPCEQLWTVTS